MSAGLGANSRRRESFDFAVIGDGPVGLMAAISLAQCGRSVALVAASPPAASAEQHTEAPDLRVYALAPDVLQLLAAADCAIEQHPRACRYQHMRVFDQTLEQGLHFQAAEYGWQALGSIVEHRTLMAVLWARTERLGIKTLVGRAHSLTEDAADSAESLAPADSLALATPATLHVELTSLPATATASQSPAFETLRASWIVDASGAQSRLREASGIAVGSHDYLQSAIIANVRATQMAANSAERTAWQRFTPEGTVAFLPLFDGSFALVYSALEAKAQALIALNDAAFLTELSRSFGAALGQLTQLGERRKIPLRRALAARYVVGRLILLGDSAHTVHPLAGQGLNMGLRDVACLVRAASECAAQGKLDGMQFKAKLHRFERERKSENAITALGIEALQKLFLPASGPLKMLRNLGLRTVQHATPIKRLFAELAAGKVAGWR